MHHIDLAVADVERSLAFHLAVLGPVGRREWDRFPTSGARFPVEQIREAAALQADCHVHGKIVVTLSPRSQDAVTPGVR